MSPVRCSWRRVIARRAPVQRLLQTVRFPILIRCWDVSCAHYRGLAYEPLRELYFLGLTLWCGPAYWGACAPVLAWQAARTEMHTRAGCVA